MKNIFGIAGDILVIGYNDDGTDHDVMVQKVLQRCKEVNLKLNKEKCHFRCTSIPFFGEGLSRRGVQPDPQKIKALMDMPPPNNKNELQAFLGIIYFLGKFSPGTTEVCDLLRKLISSKVTWTWNTSFQSLHPIAFASKSLTDAECRYSNIEREALGILHRHEKFHHYCFAREVYVITNHKPSVSVFKKMWQLCRNEYSKSC